jgi:hypothetical protein
LYQDIQIECFQHWQLFQTLQQNTTKYWFLSPGRLLEKSEQEKQLKISSNFLWSIKLFLAIKSVVYGQESICQPLQTHKASFPNAMKLNHRIIV